MQAVMLCEAVARREVRGGQPRRNLVDATLASGSGVHGLAGAARGGSRKRRQRAGGRGFPRPAGGKRPWEAQEEKDWWLTWLVIRACAHSFAVEGSQCGWVGPHAPKKHVVVLPLPASVCLIPTAVVIDEYSRCMRSG
eukprot:361399-Chlamydomonas_euryale.AAC.5